MAPGTPITVYFAAALFSGRETLFNKLLAEKLEKAGRKVLLPQRDGFEFGRLSQILAKQMPKEEAETVLKIIIYLLDIGIFVNQCDIILANLDEPIDEGVVVEIAYGRMLGRKIIGYRTDVRSPYGSIEDPLRGTHFFPAFCCDAFLWHPPLREGEEEGLQKLADRLNNAMELPLIKGRQEYHDPCGLQAITVSAKVLFEDIHDIHSDAGVAEIVKRYIDHKDSFASILPKIL